jgi:D-arabinose 1-dehydrogenase-like Zn-dependent alcohol dehydrogenase
LQESENYCAKGMTMTYNSSLDHGRIKTDSGYSYGGYSGSITVNRRFLVKVQKV